MPQKDGLDYVSGSSQRSEQQQDGTVGMGDSQVAQIVRNLRCGLETEARVQLQAIRDLGMFSAPSSEGGVIQLEIQERESRRYRRRPLSK